MSDELLDRAKQIVPAEEAGVHAQRHLGDGRTLQVRLLAWGYAYLSIGPTNSQFYDDTWQYQSLAAAMLAMVIWDGAPGTEPPGWYKHATTGRRRPNGDPAREYVDP